MRDENYPTARSHSATCPQIPGICRSRLGKTCRRARKKTKIASPKLDARLLHPSLAVRRVNRRRRAASRPAAKSRWKFTDRKKAERSITPSLLSTKKREL